MHLFKIMRLIAICAYQPVSTVPGMGSWLLYTTRWSPYTDSEGIHTHDKS